jgi:hypothetical protein
MKIWLISSKFIEELTDPTETFYKKAINSENTKKYDIFDPELNEPGFITLGTFHYDIYLQTIDKSDLIIRNDKRYKKGKIKVDQNIFDESFLIKSLKNNIEEPSSFLNLKIWKLKNDSNKDEVIFFTRCIPNKEKAILNFPSLDKDISINHYWLVAYIETVFRILASEEYELNELSINFLLHDSDVLRNKEIGVISLANFFNDTRYFDDVAKYFNQVKNNSKIYYFQHSLQSFFYRNIIRKETFFNDENNPGQKLEKFVNLAKMSDEFIFSITQS